MALHVSLLLSHPPPLLHRLDLVRPMINMYILQQHNHILIISKHYCHLFQCSAFSLGQVEDAPYDAESHYNYEDLVGVSKGLKVDRCSGKVVEDEGEVDVDVMAGMSPR